MTLYVVSLDYIYEGGKSRVRLMFTSSSPIDDRFEFCEVEV